MSSEEPPPRQPLTLGFVVAVLVAALVLLVVAGVAGIGLRAWLDWWSHLP